MSRLFGNLDVYSVWNFLLRSSAASLLEIKRRGKKHENVRRILNTLISICQDSELNPFASTESFDFDVRYSGDTYRYRGGLTRDAEVKLYLSRISIFYSQFGSREVQRYPVKSP